MSDTVADLAATLVGRHFAVAGNDLVVGGRTVAGLAEEFGTPLFIYDGGVMRASYRALSRALDGFADIHYSVKANPAPAVIALFIEEGAGVEVASVGEYRRARQAGAQASRILFAGPGKRTGELVETIRDGIGEIHVESFDEIEIVNRIGAEVGARVPVAVRINPVASAQGGAMRMGGKPTAFGFDEEILDDVLSAVTAASNLDLTGIHLFAGTQILDAEVLLAQWAHGLHLAARVGEATGRPLHTIDLGGGLGIPYFAGDRTLDLDALTSGTAALKAQKAASAPIAGARIVVEPGRYLAGPAGIYVAAVTTTKTSRGTRFVITDGGMHHHLAASGNLGQIVKKDYPVVAPALMQAREAMTATVAGPLCTPLDVLARKATLPDLRRGDLVAVLQSGAYGLSASPTGFLGHPLPAEVLVEEGVARLL